MPATMKKAALVAALAGCASAFTAPMHGLQRMDTQRSAAMRPALRMQVSQEDQEIAEAKAKMTAGAQFAAKDQDAPRPLRPAARSTRRRRRWRRSS